MKFSVDFFKDEVRDGFYIPTAIKQAWAANLIVLSEIDRICTKYDITYYADWGTLLGAVRHNGYIPWDDDLDICMKRKDYIAFREVLDKELPEGFAIHDFRTKDNHKMFMIRVINSNKICFDEEHLNKYYNFPYMAVVDVFVLDYLYKDKAKDRQRSKDIMHLIALADMISENTISISAKEKQLSDISNKYDVEISKDWDNRIIEIKLYELAERLMGLTGYDEADNIYEIFPLVLKGAEGINKHYYDNVIRIPFENTTIPVPENYNEVLTYQFGDWKKKVKNGSLHQYPYFEGQKKNLQKIANFKLPDFSFNINMLEKKVLADDNSLKTISKELIEQLEVMNNVLYKSLTSEEECAFDMSDCQQLAVDYAGFIENVLLDDSRIFCDITNVIQKYCDSLYDLYLTIVDSSNINSNKPDHMISQLSKAFDEMKKTIEDRIIGRKEILFLPIGSTEWNSFSNVYDQYIEDGDCNIYVVPLPLMFKDCLGNIQVDRENIDKEKLFDDYPKDLPLMMWNAYNINIHRPDVIYIQNPYDGENPCLSVPVQYYSKTIRDYTNNLIYIPPYLVDEFGVDDELDMHNLKYYVTTPGVIYADKVYVQSDNIRTRYIEKLVDFSGKEVKQVWEEKIEVIDN